MPPPSTHTIQLVDEAATRLSRIKQFLVRPPKGTARLELTLTDDDAATSPLAVWEDAADFKPATAYEVVAQIEASAAEEQRPTMRCTLAFVSESSKNLREMRIIHRDANVQTSQYGSTPGELTGTSLSLLIQSQKHTEMALRLMADSQVKVLAQSQQLSQHACDMVAMLAQRLAETEQRSAEADARMRDAQEALHKATHADTPEEKAEGMQKFMELVMPVLPVLMQRLLPAVVPPPASAA